MPLLLNNRYRVIQNLGSGGSGKTFLAIDTQVSPTSYCVLQQIRLGTLPDLPTDAPSRFGQMRLCQEVLGHHPQIPTLLDAFSEGDRYYFVQEWIKGRSLATMLAEEGAFTTAQIDQVLEESLPILAFLETQQVIHRDLKPANLIYPTLPGSRQAQGKLKLVDFRAAHYLSLSAAIESSPAEIVGNPEYAAPEQLQGQAFFASDLYSLGVTCIHLLTDLRPFDLLDWPNQSWVWRSYWIPHPHDSARDDQREQLARILDRLAAPRLSQRFQSAEVVLQAIKRVGGVQSSQSAEGSGLKPTPDPNQLSHNAPSDQTPSPRSPTSVSPPPLAIPCTAVLSGHRGLFAAVNTVAIDPKGEVLASGSEDHRIGLWHLTTGESLGYLQGHTSGVRSLAFSPDGQMLVSGGGDRVIKLWDWSNQQILQTLEGHSQAVNAVQFSPNPQYLISGGADKTLKLWDLTTGQLLVTRSGHRLAITALAVSSVVPLLATASLDRTVGLWDLEQLEPMINLTGHTWAVRAIACSPREPLLATGSDDNMIQLWEIPSGKRGQTIRGHSWPIASLAFSPDGQILVSGSCDKTIKLWQVRTGELIAVLTGHQESVAAVAIGGREGRTIASGSQDKTVRLWQMNPFFPPGESDHRLV